MATHWCKPLNEWHELFTNWIRLPEPKALSTPRSFSIFAPSPATLSLESLEEIITRRKTKSVSSLRC